jgi:mono/diheme cytochrome c family protein
MKRPAKIVAVTVAVLALLVALAGAGYLRATGLSARPTPGPLETSVARSARRFAIPRAIRNMSNPMASNADAMAEGREHFADHCASCHANDGSGDTEMGRGLFPRAPDMRTVSQQLTDGELFYFIEEGIRFTGMPAWGTGTQEGEDATWRLVHFIRHLPKISESELEEMETFNPRSPAELRQEMEEQRFLQGGDTTAPQPAPPTHQHPGGTP